MELTSLVAKLVRDMARSKATNPGMKMLAERASEFPSELSMQLAGIAMIPEARDKLITELDAAWAGAGTTVPYQPAELGIGAGYSMAVYSASRLALGKPKPVVVDNGNIGGAFAVSRKPAFWLNSENRGGRGGQPGKYRQSLNYLPGAPVQPSMLPGGDLQTNADMAFVIKLTLALCADVYPTGCTSIMDNGRYASPSASLSTGQGITPGRILDARGTGTPYFTGQPASVIADGKQVMTSQQFMTRADQPFPIRGLGRTAVIGGGDYGKCDAENLMGIGPAVQFAWLDFMPDMDWYAVELPTTCTDWRQQVRGRYQRLGSFLPGINGKDRRIRVYQERASVIKTLSGVLVNGRTYDHVILATGYQLDSLGLDYFDPYYGSAAQARGTRFAVARKHESNAEIYRIGVAANLEFTNQEAADGIDQIAANKVAMFRNGPRISALANMLD